MLTLALFLSIVARRGIFEHAACGASRFETRQLSSRARTRSAKSL